MATKPGRPQTFTASANKSAKPRGHSRLSGKQLLFPSQITVFCRYPFPGSVSCQRGSLPVVPPLPPESVEVVSASITLRAFFKPGTVLLFLGPQDRLGRWIDCQTAPWKVRCVTPLKRSSVFGRHNGVTSNISRCYFPELLCSLFASIPSKVLLQVLYPAKVSFR